MPPLLPNDIDLGAALPTNPADPALTDDGMGFTFEERVPGLDEQYEMQPDGNLVLVAPEDDLMPATASGWHTENLANEISEEELASIANNLLDLIDDDIESRRPWTERYRKGMEMMGLIPDEADDGPFPGSSTAVMPIISEAAVQFWARALAEQVPSEGPVKGKVLGKSTLAQEKRADRIAGFMNYDMLVIDRAWYEDHSRMLFALATNGTCFKKTYREHNLGRNVGEYVAAEDFICNNTFSHLDTAPRYTHRIWRSQNELRKLQVAGVYRDIDLGKPSLDESVEERDLKSEIQDFDGEADRSIDARYELYEVYCELDLPGYEEVDESGNPTGVGLPYIVTIDRQSEKILAIYRNWREPDPLKRPRVCFTQYTFLPGVGFYGLGLFHLIGGIQQAATGALRAIIDGSATASLQGGFISKEASLRDEELVVEPGVFKQVDATAEDLGKAFFNPPFKEPSAVLFQVMGFLVQRAEKFAATTETMTGGQDPKGSPVGTTAQMIEQGQKVFSTIHRGMHRSLADELRQRFDLIQEFLPQEGYPYEVDGAHNGLMAEDFAPGVSVLPVSDPNIFTQAQRVAQAQAVYDLAQQNPDVLKRDLTIRRVLESINVPDIDELLIKHEPPPPMDPISEIEALLRGEPVQAYPDQNHLAHLQHYAAFLANEGFGANPKVAEQIGPQAAALVGQRLAYAWATHARALGAPAQLLPPPMQAEGQAGGQMAGQLPGQAGQPIDMQGNVQQAPPELLAQLAAQIAPQMAQVPGLPSPEAAAQQAEQQTKQMELQIKQQDLQLKQADGQLKMQMAQVDAQAKMVEQELKRQEMLLKQKQAEMAQIQSQIDAEAKQQEMLLKQQEVEMKRQMEEQRLMQDAAIAAQQMQHEDERHQQSLIKEDEKMALERERMASEMAFKASEQEDKRRQAEDESMRNSAKQEQDGSIAATLADVVGRMSTSKRIVRDDRGNIVGVESVMEGGEGQAKKKKKKDD